MSERRVLDTDQKALEINLDEQIYGTFAEIGAGQEVARIFFKVGAAAGTIAKTMSAYDKTFSDKIYGKEESGRYVCESRIYTMLDHEYGLLHDRLSSERPGSKFFAFADTIAALNYQRTIPGNGWMGIRFQLHPDHEPNDFVLHVRMLDNDTQLQQSAIGILGVNMLYACYHHQKDPSDFICSLMDGIEDRVKVDLIRLTGPEFEYLDNRLLCLYMVKHGLTDVAMFDSQGQNIHGSEFLYRNPLMVVRGNFRPPTLVTNDVFRTAFSQFKADLPEDERAEAQIMAELTLEYLARDGEINDADFLGRAEMLGAGGRKVIVSNCSNHVSLIDYLAAFKIPHLGLVIGVRELADLITEKYEQHKDGELLVAFGQLFTSNITVFAYPALSNNMKDIITLANLPIPAGTSFLLRFLVENELLVDVNEYHEQILDIIPGNVYHMIRDGEEGWEKFVTPKIEAIIKSKKLFGYTPAESNIKAT
ncbi:MAG: TonB-dependent receptor [Saprospiraceae bacterium]|nr:TonB-dependent receptor [Saprospiraceae bacterium]